MSINNYDIVADLYDIYVPATFDIDFFLNETRKTGGEVLELMSGTGRVSIPLLEAGVRLTCVDNSAKSNTILRAKLEQRGLKAEVYSMDVCQLELPRQFSLIIIPFHSFAHIVSPADQRQALSRVYRHLQPDGTFICTLGNSTTRRRSVDSRLHLAYAYPFEGNGRLLLWILEQFDPDDKQVVKAFESFELYDVAGLMTSKRLMELHFRLTPKKVFEKMLQDTGFLITRLYGDYAYHEFNAHSSDSLVWVLQKR